MSLEVFKILRIDLIATIHLVEKLIFTICYVTPIVSVMAVWHEVVIDLTPVHVYINTETEWEA